VATRDHPLERIQQLGRSPISAGAREVGRYLAIEGCEFREGLRGQAGQTLSVDPLKQLSILPPPTRLVLDECNRLAAYAPGSPRSRRATGDLLRLNPDQILIDRYSLSVPWHPVLQPFRYLPAETPSYRREESLSAKQVSLDRRELRI
jgi:hypothetical protein